MNSTRGEASNGGGGADKVDSARRGAVRIGRLTPALVGRSSRGSVARPNGEASADQLPVP
jgi:hypothetical protein